MKAMLIDKERNFVWRDVPHPERRRDEVIISVRAAALNRADLMQREGSYPPPPGWPRWPGLEVSGTILEVPENSRWRVGDSVCALLGGGGYAERVAVPSDLVVPAPDGLSLVEAAGLPEVFATAHLNLHEEAGIKAGDTVFIQAGASGLGLAAIQLAKLAGAATVVATVGSDGKAAIAREYGADVVVNRKKERLPEALSRNPPDIALDCVGGPLLADCLERMSVGGRWILLATLAGARSQLDLGVFFRRRLRLIGSTLRGRTDAEKARVMRELERNYWPLFGAGRLRSNTHAVLPIAEVAEAHAILQRNENSGKVILEL